MLHATPYLLCGSLTDGVVQVVAFVLGIYWHDIYTSLFTGLVGTALAFLVVVPPWPFFKQNPVKWLPSQASLMGSGIEVDGERVS